MKKRIAEIEARARAVSRNLSYLDYDNGTGYQGYTITRGMHDEIGILHGAGEEEDEANALFLILGPADVLWLIAQLREAAP